MKTAEAVFKEINGINPLNIAAHRGELEKIGKIISIISDPVVKGIKTKNYLLKNYRKDSVWIENSSNEGMELKISALDNYLNKIFKENF